jgi:Ca-activated chloride channel homolog
VRRLWTLPLLVGLTAMSCVDGRSTVADDPDAAVTACTPPDCVLVEMAVSPEKSALVMDLAKAFNTSKATVEGRRVVVRPKEKASGEAEEQLASGWSLDDPTDPPPVIWSPAARAWGAILDDRLVRSGRPAMAGTATSAMGSPLVIAMPRRMASALGHPERPLGWADILTLANDPDGWAAHGHPEWGQFRLGKTNPRFSTSGLHAFIAQHYAALGRSAGLTDADLDQPDVVAFNQAVESSVVHYGDTTLTFLNNWHRADQRGNPYRYASAVAVEEKSVIDYNLGNPDGILEENEVLRPPREPLVAIYPKEGTIFSDSPFYVLDAPWVSEVKQRAAQAFLDFVHQPVAQERIARAGFRPSDTDLGPGHLISPDNGVDPNEPRTTMELPDGAVMRQLLGRWVEQRKPARVLLLIDVSGSMGEEAVAGQTKLDLARAAAEASLDQFRDDDMLGLRQFSTGLGPRQNEEQIDLVPLAPIGPQRDRLRREIAALNPANGTPLYAVTHSAMRELVATYDEDRINAVVLLTDGRNEDGDTTDDKKQRDDLLRFLQHQTQGDNGRPVRLFTIGYGAQADTSVLTELAEATDGRYYGATSDPTTIARVFIQVVSNF